MDPYELAERLAEYARAHFSERDADHVEMMFGVGEFDLAVDGFLVSADEGGYPVARDLLDEVERYTNEPDACELVPQWRKRVRRLWRATPN
ncbi:hypothetical protein GTA09_15275 [Rhodococcus hoagii]|nr:hypothetical protein [Prescottella equi]NKZ71056.1 hypothetical protein [Prescottella equi]